MRERLKSTVLLFLVILSMVLTARLLFGLPSLETAAPPSYEQVVFGDLRPLAAEIQPTIYFFEGDRCSILKPWENGYTAAWEKAQVLLKHSQAPEPAAAPQAAGAGQSLRVVFPFPAPVEIWGRQRRLDGLLVAQVAWFPNEPDVVYYLDQAEGWLKAQLLTLPAGFPESLTAVLAGVQQYRNVSAAELEAVGLRAEGAIYLPLRTPQMAPRIVAQEALDLDKLVRSIFVDTTLVRLIEERDGALIYTDGQRGLRVFDHGEVEYSSPKSEPGAEPMEIIPALRRASQYLQLMGGWPEHLYLGELLREETSQGAKRQRDAYTLLLFSAQQGTRLVGVRPQIKLRFSDRGVTYYNRQVKILTAEVETRQTLVDPLKAARLVAGLLVEEGRTPALVDIYPAYYVREAIRGSAVSPPVWALVFSDRRTAVVHGYNGHFLAWLE